MEAPYFNQFMPSPMYIWPSSSSAKTSKTHDSSLRPVGFLMNLNQDSFTRNNNNKPVQFGSVFLPYDDECPHAHQVVVRRTQRKGEAPITTFNVEHVPHSNSSLTKPLHITSPSPKRKAEWTA